MKDKTIIILHGWNLRGEKYKELQKLLEKTGYNVFTPDMPGFGSEPIISKSMTLSDYVEFVNKFMERKKIEKAVFIGHSFGGRVAVKFCYEYPEKVTKLILTGVPIIRNMSLKKKTAKFLSLTIGKASKPLPKNVKDLMRRVLYKAISEHDYYNSGELKEIFKNIVNEDLKIYVKHIKIPTLLIWGQKDSFTPVSDVEKIKMIMPQAKSVIVPGALHGLPYLFPKSFYDNIKGEIK